MLSGKRSRFWYKSRQGSETASNVFVIALCLGQRRVPVRRWCPSLVELVFRTCEMHVVRDAESKGTLSTMGMS